MKKLKVIVNYMGISVLIMAPVYLLYVWMLSWWGGSEGNILMVTNKYGERLIETIALLVGVPCALYVIWPTVKRFTNKEGETP